MQKAVFIIPNLCGGGAERVMSTLANYLVGCRIDVTILITKGTDIAYDLDNRVQTVFNTNGNSAIKQIMFIRNYMKQEETATYISFLTYQNMYMLLAAVGTKVKTVISERNDPSKTLYGKKWLKPIRNWLYAKADGIVFQTEGAKKYFPRKIQNRSVVILNPLKRNLPEPYKGSREHIVVAIGRLTAQKNYGLLIRAFSEFHNEYPDYILSIYGKGEQKAELMDLATSLNISESIVFEDFCEDVDQRIVNASMFVISSDYEGLSNALLEAMAIGLPCISTDSPPGGARMLIHNEYNGLLVPVGDKDEVVKAMKRIANDEEYAAYLGKNASEIKQRCNEKIVCEKWKKIIFTFV